ncbi:hypothetical protein GF357_04850 [Candidatus Dojkabacteria bacterium]|nr:hypothetical protein [Candidatus Dojkabacteria bacterium]
MKISAGRLLKRALNEKRAIPAINVSSIESIHAVFEAAAEVNSEVIIETSTGESKHLHPEVLDAICQKLGEILNVDYVLHMDRCGDLEWIEKVLKAGYNSVSAEFKNVDPEENIELSKRARKLCNEYNAALEGVADVVPLVYYAEDKRQVDTDPGYAEKFVSEVQCDSLVISVGTQSGRYKSKSGIKTNLLSEIHRRLPQMPLVLHGGSFLPEKIVKRAVEYGVAKINVNSELRIAYTDKLKSNIDANPDEYAPYRLLKGVTDEMKKVVLNKFIIMRNEK